MHVAPKSLLLRTVRSSIENVSVAFKVEGPHSDDASREYDGGREWGW